MTTAMCPMCKSQAHQQFAEVKDVELFTSDQSYQYFSCDACQVIFIHPQPVDQLARIYPDDYYANTAQTNDSGMNRIKEWLDGRLFRKVMRSIKGDNLSGLDIGGGSGWMLNLLKKKDARVNYTAVVDLNEVSRSLAAENGHDFFCSRIEDLDCEQKFDLILLLNLIEHVADPAAVLRKISTLLTPRGRVIIKTPNTDTLDRRLFQKHYWGGLHCPRHWVLFNAENFSALAQREQFVVEDLWYTQGAPQWTASILGTLWQKKWIRLPRGKNLSAHWLTLPLLALSAGFDLMRTPFAKTAQFFIVLKTANKQ